MPAPSEAHDARGGRFGRRAALFAAAAAALAALGACTHPNDKPPVPVPPGAGPRAGMRALPDILVTSLGGEAARLPDIARGRVVVLDLWATWCTACRPVSARVARLSQIYAPSGLLVLGIATGEDRATVASFLEGAMPPHPVYLDPELRCADALGRRELPAVVIADRHGFVRRIAGTLDESGVDLVRALLGEP